MFLLKGLQSLRDRARSISRAIRGDAMENPLKATAFATFQASGGIVLAIYTCRNASRIWPIMSSAIAARGIYNIFTKIRKIYRTSSIKNRERIGLTWKLVVGTVAYTTSIIAFSQALERNENSWILFLGLAATGYYIATTSINSLERPFLRRPIFKFFQKVFEPALIGCAAVYFSFRDHKEEWLFWAPFVIIGATGFKTTLLGFLKTDINIIPYALLLASMEILTGGLMIIGSSTVLAFYTAVKGIHYIWTTLMIATCIAGFIVLYVFFLILNQCIVMDPLIYYDTIKMLSGPVVFFPAGMLIFSVGHPYEKLHFFLLFAGLALSLFWRSVYYLSLYLPKRRLVRHLQCCVGPLITLYSALFTVLVGRRMGWLSALLPMAFIPYGCNLTYIGFTKEVNENENEDDDEIRITL